MPLSHDSNVEGLDGEHRHALSQALGNVLATDAALVTFAQIIDGLPICDIAWDTRGPKLTPQHPINSHVELCPGARDMAEEFRDDFKLEALVFKPELLSFHQYMDRRVLNELDYPELKFDEQMERFNRLSSQPKDE
ncbi:hypothetical protein HYQ46_012676 [Verticillium longisporum]|nr:hypothetical protein HYQ46_012676 [Verticillium longisporum]